MEKARAKQLQPQEYNSGFYYLSFLFYFLSLCIRLGAWIRVKNLFGVIILTLFVRRDFHSIQFGNVWSGQI